MTARTYFYAHPSRHVAAGLSDITPFGMVVPPLGAWELFHGGGGGKGPDWGAWGTTLALAAIVGVGVFGYLVYRNLLVSKATFAGAYRGVMGEE